MHSPYQFVIFCSCIYVVYKYITSVQIDNFCTNYCPCLSLLIKPQSEKKGKTSLIFNETDYSLPYMLYSDHYEVSASNTMLPKS